MDSKELRGLMEAYSEVYAPEQLDEVLDTPEKAQEYARKNVRSMLGAFAKGVANKDIDQLKTINKRTEGAKRAKRKAERKAAEEQKESFDIFDVVLEFLQVEGYAETLEEAEWMMANVIDEEAIGIILGEAIYSEKGKAKAAEMIAKRSTPSGRAKPGKGANVAQIRQIRGSGRGDFDKEGLGGTPMTPTIAKNPRKKQNYTGTGNKAARRAGLTPTREKPNAWKEDFELWVNELVEEGYDLSDYTWDEMYEFYLDEAQLDEVSDRLAKAARNTRERRYNASFGDGGMSANYSKQNAKKDMLNKTLASRAARTGSKIKPVDEDYVNEAQHARENPEKYEREQAKKSAPVRGEKTPMPPRGDKRREDFEKWYAKQMGR